MAHNKKVRLPGDMRLLGSWAPGRRTEAVRIRSMWSNMGLLPIAPFCFRQDIARASLGSKLPGVCLASPSGRVKRRQAQQVGWGSCPECLLDPHHHHTGQLCPAHPGSASAGGQQVPSGLKAVQEPLVSQSFSVSSGWAHAHSENGSATQQGLWNAALGQSSLPSPPGWYHALPPLLCIPRPAWWPTAQAWGHSARFENWLWKADQQLQALVSSSAKYASSDLREQQWG